MSQDVSDDNTSNVSTENPEDRFCRSYTDMSLKEFMDEFEKRYMKEEMYEWLQSNPKFNKFMRLVVTGVLDELGVKHKGGALSAKDHPIWSKIDPIVYHEAFRENPGMTGDAAQIDWLKKQKIEGAPENGFSERDYKTGVPFVSRAWRRLRNAVKAAVMKIVFSMKWGSATFPVKEDERDLGPYLASPDGVEQLRVWIARTLMKAGESMVKYTTPPVPYQNYVSGVLQKLRRTYANHDEMMKAVKQKRKRKAGNEARERAREGYEPVDSESEDEPEPQPNKKKGKKPSASSTKRRDVVNRTKEPSPATKGKSKENSENDKPVEVAATKVTKPKAKVPVQPAKQAEKINAKDLAGKLTSKLQLNVIEVPRTRNNNIRETKTSEKKTQGHEERSAMVNNTNATDNSPKPSRATRKAKKRPMDQIDLSASGCGSPVKKRAKPAVD